MDQMRWIVRRWVVFYFSKEFGFKIFWFLAWTIIQCNLIMVITGLTSRNSKDWRTCEEDGLKVRLLGWSNEKHCCHLLSITSTFLRNWKERDHKVVALGSPSKLNGCSNHVLQQNWKGTPFKRYSTKTIEQTSKFTENITKAELCCLAQRFGNRLYILQSLHIWVMQ